MFFDLDKNNISRDFNNNDFVSLFHLISLIKCVDKNVFFIELSKSISWQDKRFYFQFLLALRLLATWLMVRIINLLRYYDCLHLVQKSLSFGCAPLMNILSACAKYWEMLIEFLDRRTVAGD